ncbi:unnamed protein product, partial [Choristocarpus tenellus]
HATAVFKDKLWVVGGRSELYQAYNLEYTHRRGDVWTSSDYGATWAQTVNLTGDFEEQNFDALNPGSLAPWYARFGHTLDVLNVTTFNGTTIELMILAGGYTPDANNDVWITKDGSKWSHANWTERAWHASTVFRDRIFIVGGSPLTNDIWASKNISETRHGKWVFVWEKMVGRDAVPFSPRAGH